MARIGKTFTFEAAHRLQHHNGKCRNLHGHSYRVEVAIEGPVQGSVLTDHGKAIIEPQNPEAGMVLDFGQLKKWWQSIEAVLDHRTILENNDPMVEDVARHTPVTSVPFPPTAENLAGWILEDLQNWLLTVWPGGFVTPKVRVYETVTSWAEA